VTKVVVLPDGDLLLDAEYLPIQTVTALPTRYFDPKRKRWIVRKCQEIIAWLDAHGFDVSEVPPTHLTLYQVTTIFTAQNQRKFPWLFLQTAGLQDDDALMVSCPDTVKYLGKMRGWLVKPSAENIAYICEAFPRLRWADGALYIKRRAERQLAEQGHGGVPIVAEPEAPAPLIQAPDLDIHDYVFHTNPYSWQKAAFAAVRSQDVFALWMDPGTGKSKVMVDTLSYQFEQGRIDRALIICPATVKDVWAEQFAEHAPGRIITNIHVDHVAKKTDTWLAKPSTPGQFEVLVTNFEAWASEARRAQFARFTERGRYTAVVDESTRIKNPTAKRTKAIIRTTRDATHRYCLTGTPITQSPLDAYSQFFFLDPHIIGHRTFYSFRNEYAVYGEGFQSKQVVVGFRNVEQLHKKLAPFVFKASKDLLGLPPKTYIRRTVELSAVQAEVYQQLKDDLFVQHEKGSLVVSSPLVQLLRFQQVIGGFLPLLPVDGEDEEQYALRVDGHKLVQLEETPPKLEALLNIVRDELEGRKVVIFARFRPEIQLISSRLRHLYGQDSVLEIHGGVSATQRTENRLKFQTEDSPYPFMVLQPQVGGIGLTLTQAAYTIYYSNTYSLEDRIQTEDRTHRLTQSSDRVVYYDVVANAPADAKVYAALRAKKKLSNLVTGDTWKEWL
jgi:superfamily II DNA or RNA helicase